MGVEQAHVGTGHQRFDVHQDQHAFADVADASDEARVHRRGHLGGRADGVLVQLEHVGDRVHDRAHYAATHIEHDHHGEVVVVCCFAAELQAQVDDRNDHAAQVDDPLDERGRVRDARGGFVGTDFLNFQDVDAVFFSAQAECQEFAARLGCHSGAGGFVPGDVGGFVNHVHVKSSEGWVLGEGRTGSLSAQIEPD